MHRFDISPPWGRSPSALRSLPTLRGQRILRNRDTATQFGPTCRPSHHSSTARGFLQDIDPTAVARSRRKFLLVLIKPSHYDDDGYVIRWWRTTIPSNSLAAVYGIASDCAERQVLGSDVEIEIDAIDETNTRVDLNALLARFKRNGGFGMLGLIGVQSNQYPRALDIARPFRDADIPVVMGGFHVSGCLSMLDGRAVELDACRDMGISMFAGEAEGRLEAVLRDAATGTLAPLYNFMNDLPAIEGTFLVPFLPKPLRPTHARPVHEFRRRTRLPLPVLVLHHHQCAGPQVAISLGRRCRASGALELGAGGGQVFHHR